MSEMIAERILKEKVNSNCNKINLQWNNLNCRIKQRKNELEKYVLYNGSGSVQNKSLTAILGPSGAGKTTLLEGISRRSNRVRGTITINGYLVTDMFMQDISGFLPQYDIAFNCLTVKEYLEFMCAMKLYKTLNSWERELRVTDIFHKLSLENIKNTQLLHLSGGEKKRLFLGAELLSEPSIIFCDEPTTGLDSYNALKIISLLKDLSLAGKIIIVSIHQPSSDLINFFDNFILLSMGTIVLNGNQKYITSFFNRLNIRCPSTCNIAEFYINQISVRPGAEEECKQKINNIRNEFLKYDISEKYTNHALKNISYKKKLNCPYHIQLFWLLWRETVIMKKEIRREAIRFITVVITAFIIALFYSFAEDNSKKLQNMNGFLYLLVSELLFTATYAVLYTFPQEIPIFKREKDLYSSVIYYIVKVFVKIPYLIIYPYSFLSILYFIVSFNIDLILYFKMGMIMFIGSFTASAYGFMVSTIFTSEEYINLFSVPMDMIFLITSGIFFNVDTLPIFLKWLKYVSSFFYSFEAISTLYWSNFLSSGRNSSALYIQNTTNYEIIELKYIYKDYQYDLYSLFLLAIIMHIIACINIVLRKKQYYK